MTGLQAADLIEDGRGYSRQHKDRIYAHKSDEQLLQALSSWSPIVRQRAASRLKQRDGKYFRHVSKLCKGDLYSKLGACAYLRAIGPKAAPAVPTMRRFLKSEDVWLRIQAAQVLGKTGKAGRGSPNAFHAA